MSTPTSRMQRVRRSVMLLPVLVAPLTVAADLPVQVLTVGGVEYYKANLVAAPYALIEPFGQIEQVFEVHTGDRGWRGDAAAHNERSELVTKGVLTTQRAYLFPSHADVWISFQFKVLPGPPVLTNALVGQFHSIADPLDKGQGAFLNFLLDAPSPGVLRYSLMTRSDPALISTKGAVGVRRWSRSINMGEWIAVVLRTRFDPFGTGLVQLWINGRQEVYQANIPIGYNNVIDQGYWQYGIYRHESGSPLRVAYVNMEQGTKNLYSRVQKPLAIPASTNN